LITESFHKFLRCLFTDCTALCGQPEIAVRVRSAVIPEEFNVLLNPRHRHYGELVWTDPQRFHFDPRLFTFEPQLE
jgi:hypothetical protein